MEKKELNDAKRWFVEYINKIEKISSQTDQEEREKILIISIRIERVKITTHIQT